MWDLRLKEAFVELDICSDDDGDEEEGGVDDGVGGVWRFAIGSGEAGDIGIMCDRRFGLRLDGHGVV